MRVSELIEQKLVTISPTDTLADAWKIITESGITGAVVVTDENQVVGFVTDGDFIRACMPSETDLTIYDDIIEKMEIPDVLLERLRNMLVEEIMEPEHEVVTMPANEPVLKALALMYTHHLRRIPVLDGNELIGTISRAMVLNHLLLRR